MFAPFTRTEPQTRARIHAHAPGWRLKEWSANWRGNPIKSNLLGIALHDYWFTGVNNTKSILVCWAIVYAHVRQRHIEQTIDRYTKAGKKVLYLQVLSGIIRIIWLLWGFFFILSLRLCFFVFRFWTHCPSPTKAPRQGCFLPFLPLLFLSLSFRDKMPAHHVVSLPVPAAATARCS